MEKYFDQGKICRTSLPQAQVSSSNSQKEVLSLHPSSRIDNNFSFNESSTNRAPDGSFLTKVSSLGDCQISLRTPEGEEVNKISINMHPFALFFLPRGDIFMAAGRFCLIFSPDLSGLPARMDLSLGGKSLMFYDLWGDEKGLWARERRERERQEEKGESFFCPYLIENDDL